MALSSMVTNNRLNSVKRLQLNTVHQADGDMCRALNGVLAQLPYLKELNLLRSKLNRAEVECLANNIALPKLQVLKISLPLGGCSYPEEVLKLLKFGQLI